MGELGAASPPELCARVTAAGAVHLAKAPAGVPGAGQVTALGVPWRTIPGAQLTWVGWAGVVTQCALRAAAVVKSRGQVGLWVLSLPYGDRALVTGACVVSRFLASQ